MSSSVTKRPRGRPPRLSRNAESDTITAHVEFRDPPQFQDISVVDSYQHEEALVSQPHRIRPNLDLIVPNSSRESTPTDGSTPGGSLRITNNQKVALKVIIRRVDSIDTFTQSCFFDFWYGATTCENDSATAAFQEMFESSTDDEFHEMFQNHDRKPPVWHINLLNMAGVSYSYMERQRPTLRYFIGGSHYERQNVQCKSFQPFDLHLFPYDIQILKLYLSLDVSKKYAEFDEDRILVEFDESYHPILSGSAEWTVGYDDPVTKKFVSNKIFTRLRRSAAEESSASDFRSETRPPPNAANSYSRLEIAIPLKRNSFYYWHSIFIPIILVDFCSVFAFSMHSSDRFSDRLQFLATLLLTMFAFKWSSSDKVPKSTSLNLFDVAFFSSYSYLIGCMCISLLDDMLVSSNFSREWISCAMGGVMIVTGIFFAISLLCNCCSRTAVEIFTVAVVVGKFLHYFDRAVYSMLFVLLVLIYSGILWSFNRYFYNEKVQEQYTDLKDLIKSSFSCVKCSKCMRLVKREDSRMLWHWKQFHQPIAELAGRERSEATYYECFKE